MTFAKDNAADEGFNRWTINGVAFSMDNMSARSFHLQQGSATASACATPATTSIPSISTATASS